VYPLTPTRQYMLLATDVSTTLNNLKGNLRLYNP
jgi:hypothetical protein